MGKVPRISEAEWKVMQVVWGRPRITSNEIIDALAEEEDWDPCTIKTMLNRLIKQRALTHESRGRSYLYSPAVSRDACIEAEGSRFLDRVFGGEPAPLVAHFIENADMSKSELDQLRALLTGRKKGAKQP